MATSGGEFIKNPWLNCNSRGIKQGGRENERPVELREKRKHFQKGTIEKS